MTSPRSPRRSETFLQLISELPPAAFTKDGQKVDLTGDTWLMTKRLGLSSSGNVNWTSLRLVKINGTQRPVMGDHAVHLFKTYIGQRMGMLFPGSIYNIFFAALSLANWLAENPQWLPLDRSFAWSDLTVDLFAEWVKAENLKKQKGNFASSIRSFYMWGADSEEQSPNFSQVVAKGLSLISLEHHAVGEAVASRDKRRGPFSREELELILEACEAGKGDDHDRAIAWMLLCTGLRPQQLPLLRRSHLQIFDKGEQNRSTDSSDNPSGVFQLKVTKIKKNHADLEYQLLPLSEGCGRLLARVIPPEGQLDDPLLWWIGVDFQNSIMRSLYRFFEAADLRSPRLPIENPPPDGPFFERLPVFPRRFRSGLATDRIAQGDTPENVSEFLGHSDTSQVEVYAETTPLIADEVQRATDHAVLPLVRRFFGRIEDPAEPSGAPLIPAVVPPGAGNRSLKVLGFIGKCDAGVGCPSNPVTSCFGCPSFIARPDAPLRELRALLADDLKDFGDRASPTLSSQLIPVLNEIDEWIAHIDRSKKRAAGNGKSNNSKET